MANLDTVSKRASSVGILLIAIVAPPIPDGTLAQGDQQHIAWSYSGILAGVSGHVTPGVLDDLTTLWCQRYQPVLHAAHAVGGGYDDTTLVHADVANVLPYDDDLNTAYAKRIETDF